MHGVSRTKETTHAYLTRGLQLWKRAARECGCSIDQLTPHAYIGWLEDLLPTLMAESRRQYKAASIAFLSAMYVKASEVDHKHLCNALAYVTRMRADDYDNHDSIKMPWRGRTSSQKSKQCGDRFIKDLVATAKEMRGKWVEDAALWMVANRFVGLRPSEWRYAKLVESDEAIIFVVRNGKCTNNRANGQIRHLDITGLLFEELTLIKRQLSTVALYAGNDVDWRAYYSGVRKAIYRITRKIMGYQRKYPTLYSTRHQFSADAKSEGLSKVEVAALMGHAVDETAGIHYALKKYGRGACRVKPSQEEVKTVRVKASSVNDNSRL